MGKEAGDTAQMVPRESLPLLGEIADRSELMLRLLPDVERGLRGEGEHANFYNRLRDDIADNDFFTEVTGIGFAALATISQDPQHHSELATILGSTDFRQALTRDIAIEYMAAAYDQATAAGRDTLNVDDPHIREGFGQAIKRRTSELLDRAIAIVVGPPPTKQQALIPAFAPDAISFINARPALAAMRAMWAGGEGWQRPDDRQPFYTDKTGATVYMQEGAQFNPLAVGAAWHRVLSLDDSKVNTFLILIGKWMADTGGDQGLAKVRVHVADILSFRGLKKEPHGGYKRSQKEEALRDALALSSIWVRSIEQIRTEKGKLEPRAIDSQLLVIAIESNADLFGGFEPFAFRVAPGDWAEHYLGKHNRFVATLLRPVMRYDPDKQRIAMRLGIYLASQWRNRAHNESYDQEVSVKSLLDGAIIALPSSNPQRFREQFEQALDQLQADTVIGGWEYVNDTELPIRKWLTNWLDWGVRIIPAGVVSERYAKIPARRKKAQIQAKRASAAAKGRRKTA